MVVSAAGARRELASSHNKTASSTARTTAAQRRHTRRRTHELAAQEIGFIDNPEFRRHKRLKPAEDATLEAIENGRDEHLWDLSSAGLPPHLRRMCNRPVLTAKAERALFERMNYLKYRANVQRTGLNPSRPSKRRVAEIEDLLQRAARIRDHIILSNVRLVMSIAKKFTNTETTFDATLSAGIASLMHATEKFDFSRGYRFSTYATSAIRRDLYRLVMKNHQHGHRFCTASEENLAAAADDAVTGTSETLQSGGYEKLQSMLNQLDPRESFVVRARFGFVNMDGRKTTYSTIGKELGISKERARQIAERALGRLRDLAPQFGLELMPE